MRRDTFARTLRALGLVAAIAAPLAGCTSTQTQGKSPAYLIIDSLGASSGATSGSTAGSVLSSDVLTFVKTQIDGAEVRVPTIFADPGTVAFRLGLKDPGSVDTPSSPSATNFITVNRYHVLFIRADGRNQQGVDVPYAFDSAFTTTVTGSGSSAQFTLVRVQAKEEAPLKGLVGQPGGISTIAEVTFYGVDQAGHEVSVMGRIGVNFSDWGDPN
jgi:hypothetical protein